ncbi:hypothetical protein [Streptomyces sp. NPDC093225]|uniref:hypothetical protein n=1 Tax=Streptomyces sp. NPDC093225 TaxID=3366034 RepID=UPI003807AE74
MATSGRRLLTAVLGAALASILGCSPAPHRPDAAAAPPHSVTPPGTPPTAPAGTPVPGGTEGGGPGTSDAFCRADPPDGWRRAQGAGALAAAADERLDPVAVAPDGSSVFAVSRRASGAPALVWLRDRGARRTTVHTAAHADKGGFGLADFDGRWLVFSVLHANDLAAAWDLYAWDASLGGPPRAIGHSATAPGGAVVPGPFLYPWVHRGRATWVQAVGDGGEQQKLADVRRQVHLYDLAAGTDRIVRTGHMAPSFFAGDTVVWPEAFAVDTPTKLTGTDLDGRPVRLPAALSAADGSPAAAGNGTTWAWTARDRRTLYAWRAGWPAPAVVVRGEGIDWVHVAGDVVTWTDPVATWGADLRTRAYTRLTPRYGGSSSHGRALVVSYPTDDSRSGSYVLSGADLPRLACGT